MAKLLARVLFVLLAIAPSAALAKFDPYAGPKPIAVYIEVNPWLMVIGSDTPNVAVYDNGDIVFFKREGNTGAYRIGHLTEPQLAELRRRLEPLNSIADLKRHYDVSGGWTDQPTATLFVHGARDAATAVYGMTVSGPSNRDRGQGAELPPAEVINAIRHVGGLHAEPNEAWTPRFIEVMLWDYGYAPQASIEWPNSWPGLNSDRAIRRGDAYSIFLDGKDLPDLQKFLATQREKGAVLLGGKKWAVAYRFTFPNEPVWRAALYGERRPNAQ